MIDIVKASQITQTQKQQLIAMLDGSWESPEAVFNTWHEMIDTYLFIMEEGEIAAVGSWRIHPINEAAFDYAVNMVLFAVSEKAQGKGYGIKITLLSFLNSFKEAQKTYASNKLVYWGISANPIVINSYLKHFPFYITPRLDNTYNPKYQALAYELAKHMNKEMYVSHTNPFLLKNCVQLNFTNKELDIQNTYIENLGDKFKLDLNVANNDRLIILLGGFKSKLDYGKLYLLYSYLELRTKWKAFFKFVKTLKLKRLKDTNRLIKTSNH